MPVLVYCRPTHYDTALRVAREHGGVVRNGAKFRAADDTEPADLVILINDLPAVAATYRARGVAVEEPAAVVLPSAPTDIPPPEEVIHDSGERGAADEYRVEKSGQWFRLIGPDGEQVGKSQRREAAAWALREA